MSRLKDFVVGFVIVVLVALLVRSVMLLFAMLATDDCPRGGHVERVNCRLAQTCVWTTVPGRPGSAGSATQACLPTVVNTCDQACVAPPKSAR